MANVSILLLCGGRSESERWSLSGSFSDNVLISIEGQ